MRKRTLALLALAAVVVLAGCSGETTDTDTPIETDGSDTPTETQTPTPTDTPAPTDTPTETQTPTETETPTPDETTDGDGAPPIQSEALAAIDAVESYHLTSNTTIVQAANNQRQTQEGVSEGVFDRAGERFRVNQTVSVAGITQEISSYLVNGTVYEYSPTYASQYGAEWVTLEPDAGFFAQQDTLTRQQTFLANASVTTAGTETIDGTETQVLEADVNETATSAAIAARLGATGSNVEYNVTNVDQRLWIDTDTGRPLRTAFSMNATVSQAGQTIDLTMSADMRFTYDREVSITLPKGAESAVSID